MCDDGFLNGGAETCELACPVPQGTSTTNPDVDYTAPCGGHGTCSIVDGQPACACSLGWIGDACSLECPGVELDQVGAITLAFVNHHLVCICYPTHTHSVFLRSLPYLTLSCQATNQPTAVCLSRGTCAIDAETSEAACECNDGWEGTACLAEAAVAAADAEVAVSIALTIHLVWGISDVEEAADSATNELSVGPPIYDYNFDPTSALAQNYLADMCETMYAEADQAYRKEIIQRSACKCFFAAFKAYVETAGTFPVPSANFHNAVVNFVLSADGGAFRENVGFDDSAEFGLRAEPAMARVAWIRNDVVMNVKKQAPGGTLKPHYDYWEDWIQVGAITHVAFVNILISLHLLPITHSLLLSSFLTLF
jgi:hypothetical protein